MDSFNSENLMVEIYVQEQLWHPKPSPLPPQPLSFTRHTDLPII